jgi:hypothetical protein
MPGGYLLGCSCPQRHDAVPCWCWLALSQAGREVWRVDVDDPPVWDGCEAWSASYPMQAGGTAEKGLISHWERAQGRGQRTIRGPAFAWLQEVWSPGSYASEPGLRDEGVHPWVSPNARNWTSESRLRGTDRSSRPLDVPFPLFPFCGAECPCEASATGA